MLGYIGIDISIYYIYQGNENRRKNYETFYPPRNKKGFTLAELLIVVAIIAVLIAIAIPVFSAQLEKSRKSVDKANIRSAESIAVADYMMNNPENKDEITYIFNQDSNGNLEAEQKTESGSQKGTLKSASGITTGLEITVTKGKVTGNNWLDNDGKLVSETESE